MRVLRARRAPGVPPSSFRGRALSDHQRLPIAPSFSRAPPKAGSFAALYCARRAILIHLNDPSKLACFLSFGRAPMLVYVRPSNACPVPILSEGAGIVSTARIEGPPLYRGASASTETSQLSRSRSSASKKSGEDPVDSLSAALLDSAIQL